LFSWLEDFFGLEAIIGFSDYFGFDVRQSDVMMSGISG